MDFDQAIELIVGTDSTHLNLGGRSPVSPEFPVTEYQQRHARLAALMGAEGFTALVLTQEESIRYLTGYNSVVWSVGRWLPTVLVATVDPAQALLIGSVFDAGCATGTAWTAVRSYTNMDEIPDLVFDHLDASGIALTDLGFELGPGTFQALPQCLVQQLFVALPDPPRDASAVLSVVRMIKSPAEINRIRKSVAAAAAGYRAGMTAARPGMTEKEIVAIMAAEMFRSGTTAGTKPVMLNSVSGHARYPLVDTPASDNPIANGDIVFIDGGGTCDGYYSDILRIIAVGDIRSQDRRYAEVAQQATAAMVAAARPGLLASELFATGAGVVAGALPSEQMGVVAGHGIGLEHWERPFLQPRGEAAEDITLREGMVLCLEPILAPPHPDGGLAGIFVFEEQVVLTQDGCEVLSADLPARLWEI